MKRRLIAPSAGSAVSSDSSALGLLMAASNSLSEASSRRSSGGGGSRIANSQQGKFPQRSRGKRLLAGPARERDNPTRPRTHGANFLASQEAADQILLEPRIWQDDAGGAGLSAGTRWGAHSSALSWSCIQSCMLQLQGAAGSAYSAGASRAYH